MLRSSSAPPTTIRHLRFRLAVSSKSVSRQLRDAVFPQFVAAGSWAIARIGAVNSALLIIGGQMVGRREGGSTQ
ncbi:hypothetical protein AS890_26970 [Rhizobium anhuiense bv. trifolii]|nr:hypothetical protein AS890_26970 [Rhizobium anhuiense bv. trifolii]